MATLSIIVTVWLACMGLYYGGVFLFRSALYVPAAVAFVVCLPAMPFIVAWRTRHETPGKTKALYIIWGVFYALFALAVYLP